MRTPWLVVAALVLAHPAWAAPPAADKDSVCEPGPGMDRTDQLLCAIANADAAGVRRLLQARPDVNAANAFGDTPVREAALTGDRDILKAVLDAGADADRATPEGQTSLMIVARAGDVEAARLLIEHGAKVNTVESTEEQSALMLAADQGQAEMVRLLIAHGADVNARSREHENEVRVTAEPRVRYDPRGGLTPLMLAARSGCVDCATALRQAGAKLDAHDPDGLTPLIFALLNAHFDLAAELIKWGADVNRWDFWGRTPLWAAVDYNTIPNGGRADLPSLDRTTSLEVIQQLLEAGANPNARLKFQPPYRSPRIDRVGEDFFATGATPLLRAAKAADVPAMELLLKAGARVDLTALPQWKYRLGGVSPLMAAAGLHNGPTDTRGKYKTEAQALTAVKLLIVAGADVNGRDEMGNTALDGAVFRGWNSVVQALIEAGADPYRADETGKTPMDYALGARPNIRKQILETSTQTAKLMSELRPRAADPKGSATAKQVATEPAKPSL